MILPRGIRRALKLPDSAERLQRELNDEVAFHIAERIRELTAAGMPHDEAREHALRRFGDTADLRTYVQSIEVPHMRRTRFTDALANIAQDLRFALRQLLRAPGFATTAVLTLALGVGASTAIFSVVRGVLLRPLPFSDPDRVVYVWELHGSAENNFSDPNFADLQSRSRSFAAMAQLTQTGTVTVSGAIEPARVHGAAVSKDFFAVLGASPIRGRAFAPEEQVPNGRRAVLLSHDFWRRSFGAADSVIGKSLTLSATPHVIIGVLPPQIDFPGDADFYVAREMEEKLPSRTAHNWSVVARLAPGVTLEGARTEVSGVARALKRELGSGTPMDDAKLVPAREEMVGKTRQTLLLLLGGSLVLFLIACANVVNLLLARMTARHAELALRVALGAGRGRIMQQCMAEALALSLSASALGLGVAWVGVRALLLLQPENLPRLDEVRIDGLVLAFTAAVGVAAAAGMALIAAWRAGRGDLREALSHSQRTQGGSVSSARARRGMVVAQVAMAVVLLVAAGLFGQSYARLMQVDTGFKPGGQVVLDLMGAASRETRIERYDELLRRFRAIPGVRSAGGASRIPLGRGWAPNGTFIIMSSASDPVDAALLNQAKPDSSRTGRAMYRIASDGYFEAMGIPVLRGRAFEERDVESAPHVAVISQSLADARWPKQDPIGKVIYFGNMDGIRVPMTIVGLVGDVREENLATPPEPTLYATYRQRPNQAWEFNFVLATVSDPKLVMQPARQVVRDVIPDAPPTIRVIEEIVSRSVADRRFVLTLAGVFGAAALLLAALGIYSVISYLVAQRSRELSIRVALGATSRGILMMVMRQGVVLAGAGALIGAAIAVAATRSFQSMLFGVEARDPLIFAGVLGLLIAAAAVASWIPASRAARAQPGDAMRDA